MAGSPRSFSSANSMPGLSSGNSRFSVNPQNGASSIMLAERQELQHQQQQQTLGNTVPSHGQQQFPQDSQQFSQTQKDFQHHHLLLKQQQQQQQQQQQLVQRIGSMSHLQNQQQAFAQSLAPVKMEQGQTFGSLQQTVKLDQEQMIQQAQAMASSASLQQSVKMEQEKMNQQAQAMASSVKMEASLDPSLLQQQQSITNVKRELIHPQSGSGSMNLTSIPHHLPFPNMDSKPDLDHMQSNPNVQQSFLTSHLQRQEALQLHRQQTQQFQAQMNMVQQQRYLHQQRSQLQQQQHHHQHVQPQIHQQSPRPSKSLVFEPGICARRLMQYLFNQRQRPQVRRFYFDTNG